MNRVYLSLGSNVEKERSLARSVELLAQAVTVRAISSVYETAPVGAAGQGSFFNVAVVVETALSPAALKQEVLAPIERKLGRVRTADKNAPRTMDIDISLFNDEALQVGRRMIPDPEILTCAHLAIPLAEVAPDYVHPQTGQTLAQIAARFAAAPRIVRRADVNLKIECVQ